MKKNLKKVWVIALIAISPFVNEALAKSNQSDTTALKLEAKKAKDAGDAKAMDQAVKAYVAELNGTYTRQQIRFLVNYATSTRSEAFHFFLTNEDLVNKTIGKDFGTVVVAHLVKQDFLNQPIKGKLSAGDWQDLGHKVEPFGRAGQFALLKAKNTYYCDNKNWKEFMPACEQLVAQFPDLVDKLGTNNNLWDLYEGTNDKSLLRSALKVEKWLIDHETFTGALPMYYDTYGCILYRLGKKKDAISWVQKALNVNPGDAVPEDIKLHLKQMQNNEPTWPVDNKEQKS